MKYGVVKKNEAQARDDERTMRMRGGKDKKKTAGGGCRKKGRTVVCPHFAPVARKHCRAGNGRARRKKIRKDRRTNKEAEEERTKRIAQQAQEGRIMESGERRRRGKG
jgi:hypothetical protein